MSESGESSGGSSPFNVTSVIALLTLLSGLFLVSKKLASERPFVSSPKPVNPHEDQMVEARLWEDPFKWKQSEAQTNGYEAFGYLRTQIAEHTDGPDTPLLLAVMVEGGTYTEDVEARLRSRYAVVSALGESGYFPETAEHLGAVLLPWPGKPDWRCGWLTNGQKLEIARLSTNRPQDTWTLTLLPDPKSTGSGYFALGSGPGSALGPVATWTVPMSAKPDLVPAPVPANINALQCTDELPLSFEWYKRRNFQLGGATNKSPGYALILWLDQDRFDDYPALRLALLFKHLADVPDGDAKTNPPCLAARIAVIGPRSSSMLQDLLPAYDGSDPAHLGLTISNSARTVLQQVDLYCATPSAMDQVLVKEIGTNTLPRQAVAKELTKHWFRSFHNFGSTDEMLANEVMQELKLRQIDLAEAKKNLALISEWDTFYGRMLSLTYGAEMAVFKERRCTNRSQCVKQFVDDYRYGTNTTPGNLHSFVYLRGLDGQTTKPSRIEEAASATAIQKPSSLEELKQWTPDENKAVGEAQYDYLTRLGDRMKEREKELMRQRRGRLDAIGIVGSDLYDTLLILHALRGRFPEAVFFTTDLDARFWHTQELPWSRNLLVFSAYGLQLQTNLQGQVAPFRDSTQTAQYAATLAALRHLDLQGCANIEPRRFEIGRGGAYDLSVTEGAGLHPMPPSFHGFPFKRQVGCAVGSSILALILIALFWPLAARLTWRPWENEIEALTFREEDVDGILPGPGGGGDALRQWLRFLNTGPSLASRKALRDHLERRRSLLVKLLKGLPRGLGSTAKEALEAGLHLSGFRCKESRWLLGIVLGVGVCLAVYAFLALEDTFYWRGGEPLSLAGLSVWPTEMLRLLAAGLALAFCLRAYSSTRQGALKVVRQYRLSLDQATVNANERKDSNMKPSELFALALRIIGIIGLAYIARAFVREPSPPVLVLVGRLVSILIAAYFIRGASLMVKMAHPAPATEENDLRRTLFLYFKRCLILPPVKRQATVNAKTLWEEYQWLGRWRGRLYRTFFAFGLYFLLLLTLSGVVGGHPYAPLRGDVAWWADQIALWLAILSFLFLTFWVMDGVRLCSWFTRQLSEGETEYPEACLNHFGAKWGVPRNSGLLTDWIDMQLIAEVTDHVARSLYYPFIVLFILLVSRNAIWDRWSWSPVLIIVFSLNLLLVIGSVIMLRTSARKAQEVGIVRLKAKVQQERQATRTVSEQQADVAQKLLDEVQNLRKGAFVPFWQNPVVGAILVPSGGTALLEVLIYLVGK